MVRKEHKVLGLISCTKAKLNRKCKASELYSVSDLFKKAYAYCTKHYDDIAILSAKYGLLLPDYEVKPYDKTLNNMSVEERKAWSKMVFKQMQTRLCLADFDRIFFHAGKNYREFLIRKLERSGLKIEVPLENLTIGKQLAWYKTAYGKQAITRK
jgi:hypothetical protein